MQLRALQRLPYGTKDGPNRVDELRRSQGLEDESFAPLFMDEGSDDLLLGPEETWLVVPDQYVESKKGGAGTEQFEPSYYDFASEHGLIYVGFVHVHTKGLSQEWSGPDNRTSANREAAVQSQGGVFVFGLVSAPADGTTQLTIRVSDSEVEGAGPIETSYPLQDESAVPDTPPTQKTTTSPPKTLQLPE